MKKEELSDAIGNVDEDIVNEAGTVREQVPVKPSAKPVIIGIVSGFAALAAIIAGVVFIPNLIKVDSVPVSDTTAITEPVKPTATTTAATTPRETASAIASEPDIMSLMSARTLSSSTVVKEVRASDAVGESISCKSDLLIDLYNETSEDDLRKILKVTPEQPFTLTRESNTSYRLAVSTSFAKSSLVKVEVSDDSGGICGSWAFKTVDDFKVKSCYPADGSEDISLDSGIEVEFTFAPSTGDLSQYVTIEPSIDAKIYAQKRTLYIVPKDGLETNMGYAVTVKKGLPSADGETLAEDVSFAFRTTAYNGKSFFVTRSSYNGFAESFVPDDLACIEIMCSADMQSETLETHLYRFPDAVAYYDAIKKKTDARWADSVTIDTAGLPDVFTSNEKPYVRNTGDNGYYSSCFVMLPDKLTEGYYIAEVMPESGSVPEIQYLIEVTPVSVYMINVGDDILLYVNDTASGKPAAGASVTVEADRRTLTGTVGSDGLVKIDASGVSGRAVLDIKYGDHRYTDRINIGGAAADYGFYTDESGSDLYYSYLYTDRTAYLPTDTINVWGYMIPKARVTPLPTDVSVTFLDTVSNEVQLNDGGFFSTQFTFTDLQVEYGGDLVLRAGDTEASRKYVQVREYAKPTYVIGIETPDYAVLPQKDPFDVTLSAEYYEGTPAEGVILKNGLTDETCTTGEDGTVTVSVKDKDRYDSPWRLSNMYLNYRVSGIENTYEGAWAQVPSFFSDVMFTYEYDDSAKSLTVHANKMDFTNVEKWFAENYKGDVNAIKDESYEPLKGEALSVPVTVTVNHSWRVKTETGSYYDALEKRTIKEYSYDYRSEDVGTFTLNTVNGEAVFANLPITDDKDSWYNIHIEYKDGLGQSCGYYCHAGRGSGGWAGKYINNMELGSFGFDPTSGKRLYLLSASSEEHKEAWNDYEDYTLLKFHEDENLSIKLECANDGVGIDGMFLLAVYNNDGLVSYKLCDAHGATEFPLTADRTFIPTVRYTGAYFDGRHIYKCYGGTMQFDPERRRIELKATTDAEKYDAGDTATITVRATNVSGLPMSGATVQLSLVDEAAFAVEDQQVDILNAMYRYRHIANANEYWSYIQHLSESRMYGEKGGGGGDNSVRKDFKDTAFFDSAVTDANGIATFTVKLPDNITTWRATVQAVYMTPEDRLYAGNIKEPVVVTRPVFITPIMQNTFVVGDDIAVSAKAAGITRADPITISITGNGYNESKTVVMQQTANFGKLPAGEYKVLFTAEKNGYKDAAELPLTVAETLLETDIERKLTLSDLNSVAPTKYPVDAAFFDKEYMLNTDILYGLLSYSGDRNDMKLAAAYALNVLYPDYADPIEDMFRDETSSGLAKALRASEPSVEVTALMCAAAPDAVSRTAIVNKFRTLMDGEMTMLDRSSAYMGLAALGEPVMNEVKALLASGESIDTQSGIYLSAALAFCGDRQTAYDTYIKYVPSIEINDSDPDEITASILTDGRADQALIRTALITASVLDLPEAEGFARTLYNAEPELESYSLQLVVYLEHYVPKTVGSASFTYKDGGETKTVKLDRHHPTFLRFTKEQFESADFTVTNGEVITLVHYIGRVDQNDSVPTLNVSKKYVGTFAPGETIRVDVTAPAYCVVYDVIPSCGRYNGYRDRGRLIKLYTDKDGHASYSFTINASGEYVTEPAVVRNYRTGEWGIGESGTVTVRSDEAA